MKGHQSTTPSKWRERGDQHPPHPTAQHRHPLGECPGARRPELPHLPYPSVEVDAV